MVRSRGGRDAVANFHRFAVVLHITQAIAVGGSALQRELLDHQSRADV